MHLVFLNLPLDAAGFLLCRLGGDDGCRRRLFCGVCHDEPRTNRKGKAITSTTNVPTAHVRGKSDARTSER